MRQPSEPQPFGKISDKINWWVIAAIVLLGTIGPMILAYIGGTLEKTAYERGRHDATATQPR